MLEHRQSSALDPLLSRRGEFRAFLVSRLGSEADAADVLQNGLIKALRSASELKDEQKLTAWFYQVLRNAMVDHIRSRQAREARDDTWATERATPAAKEIEKAACRCIEPLIDELQPREAELVRGVELENKPVAEVARLAGMSPNNASVTLHRARKKLRERLEAFCGECVGGACLDCDCAPTLPAGRRGVSAPSTPFERRE